MIYIVAKLGGLNKTRQRRARRKEMTDRTGMAFRGFRFRQGDGTQVQAHLLAKRGEGGPRFSIGQYTWAMMRAGDRDLAEQQRAGLVLERQAPPIIEAIKPALFILPPEVD